MNALRKPRRFTDREFEALATQCAGNELEAFVRLSTSMVRTFGFLQERLKSNFPKACKKCGKAYQSFEEFFYDTDAINQGTVCYPMLGAEFYLHRNCRAPCDSTLVVVFNDRRDDTDLGGERRVIFQTCMDKLLPEVPEMHEDELRERLMDLLSQRILKAR